MAEPNGQAPETISGVIAHIGGGAHAEAKGFWADAWGQVIKRPGAIVALVWIGVVAFFAVAAPVIASGHPLLLWQLDDEGARQSLTSPLLRHLSSADWMLLLGSLAGAIVFYAPMGVPTSRRLGLILAGSVQAGAIVVLARAVSGFFGARDVSDRVREIEQSDLFIPVSSALVALLVTLVFGFIPSTRRVWTRLVLVVTVGVVTGFVVAQTWSLPPDNFDYSERARAGEIEARYTLVPWSPAERLLDRDSKLLPPGASEDRPLARRIVSGLPLAGTLDAEHLDRIREQIDDIPLPESKRSNVRSSFQEWASSLESPPTRLDAQNALASVLQSSGRRFLLGSDENGQDVLSQMIHACRLAISIGLVSTSIATLIGVTVGSLMGYFGGIIDLALYRVVEIFMAVPLLFILIVAAGVLPRNTYVTMAIIGCFTWTNAARYTRAEFLKLRSQDFVQSARAVGLPLRSILFRHMLPNGVTPVLVDASFAIAFAIILEATLSYLGLGPADQASWGKLLASATNEVGDFKWWLAVLPGLAIFGAALSYNLIGEALRDAIDPKLKKARV